MGRSQGVLTFVAVLIFVFLILASASGRWTKTKDKDVTPWAETGVWETCPTCVKIGSGNQSCTKKTQYLNTLQGFSLIEVGLEFLIVTFLLIEGFKFRGNRFVYLLMIVFAAGAIVANIITWTTFSAFFKKSDLCGAGEPSFSSEGYKLSWGYALRLGELGGLVVLAVLLAIGMGKGSSERTFFQTFTALFALFILLLGIITTSGRGWMQDRATGHGKTAYYVGLWDECECEQNYDLSCDKQLKRFRGAEVFSVVSIVFQFALVLLMLGGRESLSRLNIQRVLAFLNTGAMLITMAVFAEAATTMVCEQVAITDSQRFHWGFAVQCIAFIGQVLLFVALVLVGVQAAEAKTEPVATYE